MAAVAGEEALVINSLASRGGVGPCREQGVNPPVWLGVEALAGTGSAELVKLHPFDFTKRKPCKAHLRESPKALSAAGEPKQTEADGLNRSLSQSVQ